MNNVFLVLAVHNYLVLVEESIYSFWKQVRGWVHTQYTVGIPSQITYAEYFHKDLLLYVRKKTKLSNCENHVADRC